MIFVVRKLQSYKINLNLKSSNYIMCFPRKQNLNIAQTAYFTNIFLVFTLFSFGHYFISFVFKRYILSATVYVNIWLKKMARQLISHEYSPIYDYCNIIKYHV